MQRAILKLSRAAPWAFGSTNVDWRDVTGTTVYAASHIIAHHGLYGAFVASMLESLYSGLGEIGDSGAPALMVMIDEAHLVFDGASPAIVRRIEQITRLIRSKGVGLIYVTQAPADLPDAIAGQMATRIQHGLRAATASQGKAARAAADTMPGNATLQDVLTLGIGQALVSVPDARGVPLPARKVNVTRGKINLESLPYAMPPGPEAANRPFHDPREPINFKPDRKRRWYYWPLVIAAWIYGPLILLEILF